MAGCPLHRRRGLRPAGRTRHHRRTGLIGTGTQAGFYQRCRTASAASPATAKIGATGAAAIACVKANDWIARTGWRRPWKPARRRPRHSVLYETPLAVEHAPSPAAAHCIDATRALAKACVAWHRAASAQTNHL
jgi:hypothetical protein